MSSGGAKAVQASTPAELDTDDDELFPDIDAQDVESDVESDFESAFDEDELAVELLPEADEDAIYEDAEYEQPFEVPDDELDTVTEQPTEQLPVPNYIARYDHGQLTGYSVQEKRECIKRFRNRMIHTLDVLIQAAKDARQNPALLDNQGDRPMTVGFCRFLCRCDTEKVLDVLIKHIPGMVQVLLGMLNPTLADFLKLPSEWRVTWHGVYVDVIQLGDNYNPYVGSATGTQGLFQRIRCYQRILDRGALTPSELQYGSKHEAALIQFGAQANFRVLSAFDQSNVCKVYPLLFELMMSIYFDCFKKAKVSTFATESSKALVTAARCTSLPPSTHLGGLNDAIQLLQGIRRGRNFEFKCSNQNCNSTTTSKNWYSATAGVPFVGVICEACYLYARRNNGALRPKTFVDQAIRHRAPKPADGRCMGKCKKVITGVGSLQWRQDPKTLKWYCRLCISDVVPMKHYENHGTPKSAEGTNAKPKIPNPKPGNRLCPHCRRSDRGRLMFDDGYTDQKLAWICKACLGNNRRIRQNRSTPQHPPKPADHKCPCCNKVNQRASWRVNDIGQYDYDRKTHPELYWISSSCYSRLETKKKNAAKAATEEEKKKIWNKRSK